MRIKKNILQKIKSDKQLKAELTAVLDCSIFTIERWCNPNYKPTGRSGMPSPLTNEAALEVIRKKLGLKNSEILDRSKQAA